MRARLSQWLNSLTAKYVAVFVLLVAIPAIGISWYLLDSSYNDNKAALVREQQDRAGALAGKFEDSLDKTVEGLRTVHLEGLSPADIQTVLDGVAELQPFGQPFYLNCEAAVISTHLV